MSQNALDMVEQKHHNPVRDPLPVLVGGGDSLALDDKIGLQNWVVKAN